MGVKSIGFCSKTSYLLLAIENEYHGPELEDGKVTLQFMKDLMALYKSQGKLHRKYAYKVHFVFINIFCLIIVYFRYY